MARKEVRRLIYEDAAGIDLSSQTHWVAVPADRDEHPVQSFGACTAELIRLRDWLVKCAIKTVAMESTGVYWVTLYTLLEEAGLEVCRVNAKDVKNVPGRKSDRSDCQWLQELHSWGLLRASFIPSQEVRVLRTYWRQRESLIVEASREIQHMQKALTLMNLLLPVVLSDVTGVTGMAIIRAILTGERDPKKLARLRQAGVAKSSEEIERALEGDYREEQLFCLRQAVDRFDFFRRQIEDCDRRLEDQLKKMAPPQERPPLETEGKRSKGKNAPNFDARGLLYQVTGADLTELEGLCAATILKVIAGVGTDRSRFRTAKHFCSYLLLSPHHRVSGGKVLSRRGRPGVSEAGQALRMAVRSLLRSNSELGAFARRLRARLGPAKAIMATARKLACRIYYRLRDGGHYVLREAKEYEAKFKERVVKNLKKRAQEMGYQLVPSANA